MVIKKHCAQSVAPPKDVQDLDLGLKIQPAKVQGAGYNLDGLGHDLALQTDLKKDSHTPIINQLRPSEEDDENRDKKQKGSPTWARR